MRRIDSLRNYGKEIYQQPKRKHKEKRDDIVFHQPTDRKNQQSSVLCQLIFFIRQRKPPQQFQNNNLRHTKTKRPYNKPLRQRFRHNESK